MTTMTRPSPARPAALPSTLHVGFVRGAVELKQFFRQKDNVVFTFSMPAMLLVLLGSVFNETTEDGVTGSQIFAASMIGFGIVSTAFISMGTGIALDREDGTLKRLRGTPITPVGYFIGKLIMVLVATVAEVALLLAVGVVLFDLPLPSDPARWLTFGWVFGLSVVACTALGVVISSVARSARSAPAVTNMPALALAFLSGIFINPITVLPDWMVTTASAFPLKWMGQGFRSVFLPDTMVSQEAAGSWELELTAAMLAGWCVLGIVLCALTFRWTNRKA